MLKDKTGKSTQILKPRKRLFRMLRPGGALPVSPAGTEAPFQEGACKDVEEACADAMLEAEFNKARALRFFRNSAVYC